ncbi:hypothetical protein ASF49_13680 [Methylobacterium sp. Leaf104]|uniref:hypothetical protein n=1 Tax=Methylobacterium TaxID=407 RepID=UPI0006FE23A9|nr:MULTISPECIES: hypothetical protein [Methylobacterium]KQP30553.1 hypothetical protein ASF49_13680 [Methylobacterium sp. Leaf104]MCI9882064.1 hypothetical protein [Methylobacterium goesingense]
MATRRPATAPRERAFSRRSPLSLALAGLALGLGSAPAAAQYMALTAPAPAPRPASPEAPKPVAPTARPVEHAFNGQLPNQRTGLGRQRVVRDICIGCDR